MKIIIVTGMSGAGRMTALNVLEDEGFYCVNNMPITLIPKFVELANSGEDGYTDIAFSIDVRGEHAIEEFDAVLSHMQEMHYNFTILYLDASDEVLVKRYKETRRSHPLAKEEHSRVEESIFDERKKIKSIKEKADFIIDTSQMLTREFKAELQSIFLNEKKFKNLFVTVLSFGFKYGIPSDADLVFDVRFLPNPYYDENLKHLTGNDKAVQDYVMKSEEAGCFLNKIQDLITFLLPNYVKEGKNSLVIAVGCTGGKHRSVTLANAIYDIVSKTEYGCKVEHRDIEKDARRKG